MSTCLYGDNSTTYQYEHEQQWCLTRVYTLHSVYSVVGCGFKPRRGLIQGVQTIVHLLVNLTPLTVI